MTPPIEPEAEPLTASELDDLRTQVELSSKRRMALDAWNILATIDRLTERVEKAGWLAEQDSCTIERLTRERDEWAGEKRSMKEAFQREYEWRLATIERLTRERDEALRVAARGVGDAQDTLRWMNRAFAAERTVSEQREALERIVDNDGISSAESMAGWAADALARSDALAPNTEEGPQ